MWTGLTCEREGLHGVAKDSGKMWPFSLPLGADSGLDTVSTGRRMGAHTRSTDHMSRIALGTPGIAYVLANGSFLGLLKLGATTLTAEQRARQLSAATGVPTPFYVVYSRTVADVNAAEAEMHRLFADRRVNDGREFFEISVYEACVALDRIAGGESEMVKDPPTPFAELFATFPDDDSPRSLTAAEQAQCRVLAAKLWCKRSARIAA